MSIRTLYGAKFLVTADYLLAKHPDKDPDDHILFKHGFTFAGELDLLGYMLDDDIPLDSLTLNFMNPDIFMAEADKARQLRVLTLQVPVLAINSCRSF